MDASLEGPILIYVQQGVYRCKGCYRSASGRLKGKSFRFKLPFTVTRGRYTNRARRIGVDGVKLDGLPFTKMVKRMAREFLLRPARSTLWRWHADEGKAAAECLDYRKWLTHELSGVLCIDEAYDGEFCVLTATDPLAKVTVGFQVVSKKKWTRAK